jgi:hypothetical protein
MTEKIIVDPIAVEQASQEELHGATHRVSLGSELVKTNFEASNLAVVTDEFDDETFDENIDTEAHVEEDIQPIVDTAPDAPVGTGDEVNELDD